MAVESVGKFNYDVEKFARDLPTELLVPFQKKIAFELLARIVAKNPVAKIRGGRSRAGWQVTIDNSPEVEVQIPDPVATGVAVIAQPIPPFSVIYITNNVFYIVYLEGGSSQQAPAGMVAVSLEELKAIFPDAA